MPREIIKVAYKFEGDFKKSFEPIVYLNLMYVNSTQIIKIVLYRTCLIIKMSFRSIFTFCFR